MSSPRRNQAVTFWTDERLRELGKIWRTKGLAAAKAAYPQFSAITIRNRCLGYGDCKCVRDLEHMDKLNALRDAVVKKGRMDSSGLAALITSRDAKDASKGSFREFRSTHLATVRPHSGRF